MVVNVERIQIGGYDWYMVNKHNKSAAKERKKDNETVSHNPYQNRELLFISKQYALCIAPDNDT